jgi:hypothetical protein
MGPRNPTNCGTQVRLSAGNGSAPRTVALCGLGGAGKTSVAVEYAYRHLDQAGAAWQFAAEDVTVLAAGFAELAAQLGARGLAETRDPVASVHAVLARFAAPWLLIFDNAADMASVAAFLPPARGGRVLITSQNPNWSGQVPEVPVLDPDEAARFLASRTGDPDRQAARALASEPGGLPVADTTERDMNITASGGGVATGVIHGTVAPPNPPPSAPPASRAGRAGYAPPGSIVADRGGGHWTADV